MGVHDDMRPVFLEKVAVPGWNVDSLGRIFRGMVMDNFPLWALAALALFFGSLMVAMWLDGISNKRRKRDN